MFDLFGDARPIQPITAAPPTFPWPNPNNKEIKRLQTKLDRIEALYKSRCKATVHDFTEGEEMFLADLSMILHDELAP